MKTTIDQVSKLLNEQGFECKGVEIQYYGERVGRQWNDELVLVNEYPGITFKYYENARKTCIPYKDPEAKEKITEAIRTIKKSHRKYEQKLRDEKVNAVKMYFDLRKTQQTINDIPMEVQLC